MNDVVIASTSADAAAVEAVKSHHAELAGGLTARVAALTDAARTGRDVAAAQRELTAWCDAELLPHARAEEAALYPAGHALPQARLLVDAMVAEHRVLADLVDRLRSAAAIEAVAAAASLQMLFDTHLVKENDQLLPLLAESPDVSLADLLAGMHEALGGDGHQPSREPDHGGHSCACGEHDPAGDPELDARVVPHAIRHATIFGALDSVRPGAGLVLVAPHDPLPLLAQIDEREPGAFDVSYLERGPEAWRLRFARRA